MSDLRILVSFIFATTFVPGCGNKTTDPGTEPEPEPETAGVVISALGVEGDPATVQITREGSDKPVVAAKGEKIYPGDRVSVTEGVSALMRLESGDRIGLNSSSSAKLVSSSAVMLEKGELWVDGALTGKSTGLRVSAGSASVGLDAAFASVRIEGTGLRTSLVSGKGTVSAGAGQAAVQGGQEAVVEGDQVTVHTLSDAGRVFGWTEAMRVDAAKTETGYLAERVEGGLGTLSAKPPGSKTVLPFETLGQDVTVRIQDQVATTTIEQVFRNPTNQVVEGTYKFPLPPGAKLTRYDMEIGGKLMPGEIVARGKGRKIMQKVIDEFLWKMRDPALVEWESGSTFSTRIFPIKAKEKKRIVMSYIQTLEGVKGQYRYVLPVAVAGAEAMKVPEFRMSATVASGRGTPSVGVSFYEMTSKVVEGTSQVDFEARDFAPPVDIVIDIAHPEAPVANLITYGPDREAAEADAKIGEMMSSQAKGEMGDYFMLSITPEVTGGTLSEADDWIVLVDTSQSRTATDMQIQKGLVDALVASLSFHDRIKIMTYGMRASVLGDEWERPSFESLERIRTMLEGIQTTGATNIESALSSAMQQVDGKRRTRIVLIGDGAPTLGELGPAKLAAHAKTLIEDKDITLTTIGVGSSVDTLLLEKMALQTGGKHIHVSSGENILAAALTLVSTIRAPLISDAKLSITGIEVADVQPATLGNLSGGEEIIVTGRYTGTGTAHVKLTGKTGDQDFEQALTFPVGPGQSANSFVPLIWASRKMDALEVAGDEDSVAEAVALSKRFGIPCRHTSLIVLENEAMYNEFGVDHTDRISWDGTQSVVHENVADLGSEGIGSGGGGSGTGLGAGAGKLSGVSKAVKKVPKIKMGNASMISGGLSKEIIRKVIRVHTAEVKFCYEKELAKKPDIEGRVVVQFVISGTGAVTVSKLASSTIGSPNVESCIVNAVRRWKFPQPEGGGIVVVTYPFVLKMGDKAMTTVKPYIHGWLGHGPGSVGPDVSIVALPPKVDAEKADKKLTEYVEKIEKDPLSRKYRKKHVDYLMALGRYDEATDAVAAWSAVDKANPTVLLYRGHLVRLTGDNLGAAEIYSGILDIDPEDDATAEMLATWHETRGEWAAALPYRVMLQLKFPEDTGPVVRRAVAEALVGQFDDAKNTAMLILEPDKEGILKAKKGHKLTAETLQTLVSIIENQALPDGLVTPDRKGAEKSKVKVTLTWQGDADLDLWVSNHKGELSGGPWDDGILVRTDAGSDGEIFYMAQARSTKLRFSVLCNSEEGCKDTSGEISIEAYDKNKKIPFTLGDVWGADIVKLTTEQQKSGW